jgi:hypothetical protein
MSCTHNHESGQRIFFQENKPADLIFKHTYSGTAQAGIYVLCCLNMINTLEKLGIESMWPLMITGNSVSEKERN